MGQHFTPHAWCRLEKVLGTTCSLQAASPAQPWVCSPQLSTSWREGGQSAPVNTLPTSSLSGPAQRGPGKFLAPAVAPAFLKVSLWGWVQPRQPGASNAVGHSSLLSLWGWDLVLWALSER
jgi:hypothetical protein